MEGLRRKPASHTHWPGFVLGSQRWGRGQEKEQAGPISLRNFDKIFNAPTLLPVLLRNCSRELPSVFKEDRLTVSQQVLSDPRANV